jgi:hypothetical protein
MFDNRGLAFHGVLGGLQKKFSLAVGEISEISERSAAEICAPETKDLPLQM